MEAEISKLFVFMVLSIGGLVIIGILLSQFKYIDIDVHTLIYWFSSIIAIIFVFLAMSNSIYNSYDENTQYVQNASYPIFSKEIVREKEKIAYKLNFEKIVVREKGIIYEINEKEKPSILKDNTIYVTKEEYDLLKEGDEIPFIFNTETKSIRLNEKEFAELIESLKNREDAK